MAGRKDHWTAVRAWAVLAIVLVIATSVIGVRRLRDNSDQPPQMAMRSLTIRAGETRQLSVTDKEPVSWGLVERARGSGDDEPTLPLKVSRNGRYLVDQHDHPWRVQADAGWLMSALATPAQVDEYLSTRRRQGFNAFYLHIMVHPGGYPSAPDAPNDWRGDPPLAKPGDYSTAGDTRASRRYWMWIDSIIDKAAAKHMVVMLAYGYLGVDGGNQGWYQDILAQPSRDVLYRWGVWLGNRYKSKKNVIWFGLGDFTPPPGSEGARRARAMADGIKSTGASQLFMAEASPPDGIPGEVPYFRSVVDMNSFYGYGPGGYGAVYETADRAYGLSPAKPAWMQEGTYEYENNLGHFSAQPWDTRRGRYWSVLAGGTAGDGFGSKDAWQWVDLPKSLSTPGALYSTVAFELFRSLPWWTLEPSGTTRGHTGVGLVPTGRGQWGGLDYITSARTSDHEWLLAYVPVTKEGARSFSVAMSALSGPTRARWFDPTNGNYLAIGKGYENTSRRTFTTPGSHSDGTDDWMLVLDSTGKARCGSVTASGRYTAPTTVPIEVKCSVTASLEAEPSVISRVPVTITRGP